jgi:hypothetical protein
MRLRRLRAAAVRFLSLALFMAVRMERSLRRLPTRLAIWEVTRSMLGRCLR